MIHVIFFAIHRIPGKIYHSRYLRRVTSHGYGGIYQSGERRMSRPLSLHTPSICFKVINHTFWQRVFEISIEMLYKGLHILLFPLWHIPQWHKVSYGTVTLSGILSLCIRWQFVTLTITKVVIMVEVMNVGVKVKQS